MEQAEWPGSEVGETRSKAAARGLADGVEGGLRALASLPEAGAIGLTHHIGLPWEPIAPMVPGLPPRACEVLEILEEAEDQRISSDDP